MIYKSNYNQKVKPLDLFDSDSTYKVYINFIGSLPFEIVKGIKQILSRTLNCNLTGLLFELTPIDLLLRTDILILNQLQLSQKRSGQVKE